jgi:GNAT superfamily N-acetyltransferase
VKADPDRYVVRPLDVETWEAFTRLVEKHHGVWGGCWCTWFHRTPGKPSSQERSYEGNRTFKEGLVREGNAHAALVFDGESAVGWCQYGTPAELPNIYHRRQYLAEQKAPLPHYRITCFFVDRNYRRHGVAALALDGALDLIAKAGGGVVEAYPHDTKGQKVHATFLYSATRSLFERAGFEYERPKGAKNCVMRKTVSPS